MPRKPTCGTVFSELSKTSKSTALTGRAGLFIHHNGPGRAEVWSGWVFSARAELYSVQPACHVYLISRFLPLRDVDHHVTNVLSYHNIYVYSSQGQREKQWKNCIITLVAFYRQYSCLIFNSIFLTIASLDRFGRQTFATCSCYTTGGKHTVPNLRWIAHRASQR